MAEGLFTGRSGGKRKPSPDGARSGGPRAAGHDRADLSPQPLKRVGQGGGADIGPRRRAGTSTVPPDASDGHIGNLLFRLRPDLSAAAPIWPRQKAIALLLLMSVAASIALFPTYATTVMSVLSSAVFLTVVVLRLIAVRQSLAPGPASRPLQPPPPRVPDGQLPTYAVFVALYEEAAVVPGLVEALSALDYPPHRLSIRLVVEERDIATQAAISSILLPRHMQMIVVPDGKPRTKPRALNYALSRTPGEFVVIYDAEDVPERDQLRRALAAFAEAPAGTGCLQARLNVMNHDESWVSRGIMAQTPLEVNPLPT